MVARFLLQGQHARPAGAVARLTGSYGKVLAFTLKHRFAFVISILLLFGGSLYLFTTIQQSFAGRALERQVVIHADIPRRYQQICKSAVAAFLQQRLQPDFADSLRQFPVLKRRAVT